MWYIIILYRHGENTTVKVENITYDNSVRDAVFSSTYEDNEGTEMKQDYSYPTYENTEGLVQDCNYSLNNPVYESVEGAVSDYESAIKIDLLESAKFDDEIYDDTAAR